MSKPDDSISLELNALREANDILRDEVSHLQLRLAAQNRAAYELATSLWKEAELPETSAVRAALLKDVAKKVDFIISLG